ncbi:MAG: cytochrome P450 [Streptomycetaceae bacterium]|nr:cytochrome P450 [Streptomycetaceae bacterium]
MRDDRLTACAEHFDHHSAAFAENRYDWYRELRERHGPVFWSPNHGGFWVVVGLEELTEAARDWRTFSSRFGPAPEAAAGCEHGDNGDGSGYDGLFAPPMPNGRQLLQADPPRWRTVRRALAPLFTPQAAQEWRTRVQQLVDACIDQRIGDGRIDFMRDLARPVSTRFSLELAGLPTDDWETVCETWSLIAHLPQNDPRWADLAVALEAESQRIEQAIDHHETDRGDDVISILLDARDAGTELTRADIHELAQLVIAAGLDTTAALVGSAVVMLAGLPALRHDLARNPELLDEALEEFTRLGTPTQGLLRTVTRDVEVGGRLLRRGERVMLCFGAADRDPRVFADPDAFAFGRPARRSVAFGAGIHKCLGIHFARMEFEIVMRTVLDRIPDFAIAPESVRPYDSVGIVAGWSSIPAAFTPGRPAARPTSDTRTENTQS